MDPDLAKLATDLSARFPDVTPVAPLKVLGSGFDSLVVETPNGVVFSIARDAETGARFNFERLLLDELAPRLPVSVPAPRWQTSELRDAPHGVMGYQKLDGVLLNSEILTGAPARLCGHGFLSSTPSRSSQEPSARAFAKSCLRGHPARSLMRLIAG
jgi:hypothetical protein